MKIKLTKTAIDKLEPGDRTYMATFYGFPGLAVRVHPTGRKVFTLEYTVPGYPRRRMTIGPYGPITLEGERSVQRRYGEAVAQAASGVDPQANKEAAKETPTFGEWADEYIEWMKVHRKNPKNDIMYIKRAKKEWGRLKLDQITRRMVIHMRDELCAGGTKNQTANKWRISVCTCFNHAIDREYIVNNPAAKIKALDTNGPRERVFSEEEMEKFLKALDQEDPYTRALFRLMVFTGCRQGEATGATWGDFDLDQGLWTIPAFKSKSGRTDTVPVSQEVVEMLRELGPRGDDDPVVPAARHRPNGSKHRSQVNSTFDRILADAGLPSDLRPHDIRRTFGLRVALGSGLYIASKLLRHSSVKITEQVYAPFGVDARGVSALRDAVNGVS